MLSSDSATYDIFITHAWRHNDDWNRCVDMLEKTAEFKWRNLSVPWLDPALDPDTEVGSLVARNWLETQILPCHIVLFLDAVYALGSGRKWLERECSIARSAAKPIIGLPAFGAPGIDMATATMLDSVVPWDGSIIAQAIRDAGKRAKSQAPADDSRARPPLSAAAE